MVAPKRQLLLAKGTQSKLETDLMFSFSKLRICCFLWVGPIHICKCQIQKNLKPMISKNRPIIGVENTSWWSYNWFNRVGVNLRCHWFCQSGLCRPKTVQSRLRSSANKSERFLRKFQRRWRHYGGLWRHCCGLSYRLYRWKATIFFSGIW